MKNTIVRIVSVVALLALIMTVAVVLQWSPDAEAAPGGQRCGGIQGLECSNPRQVCVDDPRDNCDPKTGGADCIGICRGPGAGNTK
jgi:hypothetical protein